MPKGSLIIKDGMFVGIVLGVNVWITFIANNPAQNMHKFLKIELNDQMYINELKRKKFNFEIMKRIYEYNEFLKCQNGQSSNQNQ